jgi:hypothetical protein
MSGRLLLLSMIFCVSRVYAQDPFEIHIYEYQCVKPPQGASKTFLQTANPKTAGASLDHRVYT